MKLNTIFEASNGEQAVNFSDDIGDIELDAERQKQYLAVGLAALKAGFKYKGMGAKMLNFDYSKDDDTIELTLTPKSGTLMLEVINEGEQKFSWKSLRIVDFTENTELDFKRIISDLVRLMGVLDETQKFIGTAPDFEG